MTVTICASISSTPKIKKISDELSSLGHKTEMPYTSQKIINGDLNKII